MSGACHPTFFSFPRSSVGMHITCVAESLTLRKLIFIKQIPLLSPFKKGGKDSHCSFVTGHWKSAGQRRGGDDILFLVIFSKITINRKSEYEKNIGVLIYHSAGNNPVLGCRSDTLYDGGGLGEDFSAGSATSISRKGESADVGKTGETH